MKWLKKGLVFSPDGRFEWMVTHASIPFAENLNGNLFRIYFYSRNNKNRSQIGYLDTDINCPKEILNITGKPILGLGKLGCFDDCGVTTSWNINYRDKIYLYYSGWSKGVTVPFYFYIGLAISDDKGKTFKRFSEAPILERNIYDYYLTASPCILIEKNVWRMWYSSCIGWENTNGKPKHYYHIKYAESKDGINWDRKGIVCIDFKSKYEYAITRPCVMKDNNVYKMWYSYRASEKNKTYRIGYAESKDGLYWDRKDNKVGIDVSKSGWDSEMICYAYVFKHKEKKYMFYNGNSYGKTGFGLAVLEKENS